MIIYKITNIKNGKFYIGKTTRTLELRFKEHCNGKDIFKMPIASAIKKYGKENFKIESLYTTNNLDDLNLKEIYFIDSFKPDYNVASGGQGGNLFEGKKHSQETKDLIRQKRIGKKDSLETREKKKLKSKNQALNLKYRSNIINRKSTGINTVKKEKK